MFDNQSEAVLCSMYVIILLLSHVIYCGCCLCKIVGPRPDWDPDIVAALDDAIDLEDPDNILEDNFILKVGKNCNC